jgi:tetratricopeptide (TPR) repeat protein
MSTMAAPDQEIAEQLFEEAENHFKDNKYNLAEPILNQLVLKSVRRPDIFHMLGTIYYDQGKFKKAIHSFKRALEIDPSFTDSSVGLSIILNDLGRYEEGRKVFEEAQLMLSRKNQSPNTALNEKFAVKHAELGDLYVRHQRFEEALEQYQKAFSLSQRRAEMKLHMADCYFGLGQSSQAIRELREILKNEPRFVPALLRLGRAFYDLRQIPEAIEQWETVLSVEPENKTAKDFLRLVQAVQVTSLNEPMMEI